MSSTRWELQHTAFTQSQIENLAGRLEISPLLARLLTQRGFESAQAMDRYLSPGLRHLSHWKDWPAVEPAADIICRLVDQHKKIAVWGDYDVDGISATALLALFFKQRAQTDIIPVIPHRSWGYGLNTQKIEQLHASGVQALITVDCGITALKEIQRARELGITTIVTDHHTPASSLPVADAVVNPRILPCPAPQLAGVGVAFYLAAALNNLLPGTGLDIRNFLDLVALGTVADLVPLDEQNRILVKNGLLLLQEAKRPGIAALKAVCDMAPAAKIGTGEISFGLAPRLNAAGRIGDPELAFQTLVTQDSQTAASLAKKLDALNEQRKKLEETTCLEAEQLAEQQQEKQGLVLYQPHWDSGIIGIVASKMVETFYKPCLMLTKDNKEIKGSGRSISQVNLYQALAECTDELEQFGGHRLAAGLRLQADRLQALALAFDRAVRRQTGEQQPVRSIKIDATLPFSDIDLPLIQELDLMQPFGTGNRKPVFQSQPVMIQQMRAFGKGKTKHLELQLRSTQTKATFQAVGWNMAAQWKDRLRQNIPYILAFRPGKSSYKGLTSINLQLEDIKIFQ